MWTRITMLFLGRTGLEHAGRTALSRQPDRITLVPRSEAGISGDARAAIEQLVRRGFARAGSFAIPEMGDVPVHLLVKPGECAVAAVYEHPEAGTWSDIVSRYQDDRSWLITNARLGGGLDARPGNVKVRAPGLTPAALHLRFARERPAGPLVEVPPQSAAGFFMTAYEEEIAWLKGRGLNADEVKRTGLEPYRRSA
jgi:hypothetical protein